MQQPAPRSRTVFRACVVNAVREGELLMQQLVTVTRGALTVQENELRDIARRNLASDALRLLNQHEAALLKGYPMALLEVFADGPEAPKTTKAEATGLDFGELTLVDDDEVQAQVELSRAQQLAMHATEAVLSELNGLVSSAQGLRRVHPERNPLRPENYIRALQQVIAGTGVAAPIREAWMQSMRNQLGSLLVDVYKRAAQSLRDQGVQPVGFGAAPGATGYGPPGRGGYDSAYAAGAGSQWGGAPSGQGYGAGYGGGMGYGASTGYGRPGWATGEASMSGMAPDAEEALLTVGILRQMLAGGGDPFESVRAPVPMAPPAGPGRRITEAAPSTTQGAPISGHYAHMNVAAVEAMEDIAQLERLVGRLAGSSQPGYVPSGHSAPRSLYGVSYGAAEEASPAQAAEVVARMVENIAQDSRLLPPVQQAVQRMEPAIRQLVRHDARFFSDANHPARRLLDEVTQRSLAYTDVNATGFRSYMRLVQQAVDHLAQKEITSATPFEAVLKALESAWAQQEKKLQARREAEQQALLQAEQREMLAEKIAANIQKLSGVGYVPADIMEFATGPWARVAAQAQVQQPGAADGDPDGYLAVVPELFWSVQPDLVGTDKDRLIDAIPSMLAKLRQGLQSINHPVEDINAFVERLVLLHQQVLDAAEQASQQAALDAEPSPETSEAALEPEALSSMAALDVNLDNAAPAASAEAEADEDPFYIGAWVDLVTNGKVVRTQLTWASPHNTLFLFTGADGSTQSMTRRMRDKLAAEGLLRVLPRQHVVDRAIGAMASSSRQNRRSSSRK
jgi:hypothetical protein